ncbi:MAG: DNA repair and recombination protein RadB, partial [Candidatus Altiarchaeota archaeon]|nr:DNA repair and recombination protein RadB [Candidatus Altiarchaeota archaeon]
MICFGNKLDDLLGGGVSDSLVTHIFGPPASGKTNLALMASVAALGKGKVIYIDPEGGFSVERIRQLACDRFHEVLGNILLVKPTTFDEQKLAFARLDELVTSMKVSLIVVDSIAMLYRMEEDKDVRMLGRMLAQLLRVARKYELPVLLTNQVYSDYETKVTRPIGGTIGEYFTKNMVELVRNHDGTRHAILRRHISKHEGEGLEFRIVDSGIEVVSEFCTTENPL